MSRAAPKFDQFVTTPTEKRQRSNRIFWLICVLTSSSSVAILLILLLSILFRGMPTFFQAERYQQQLAQLPAEIEQLRVKLAATDDPDERSDIEAQIDVRQELLEQTRQLDQDMIERGFLNKPPSPNAFESGIGPALMGSIWVCAGCAVVFLPLGVATAIFLEEFKPRNRFLRWFSEMLQLNISNLAGVPSIVYGILGLTAFAYMFGVFGDNVNEPKFEIGTSFSWQFVTEGMQVVFIPAESRDDVPVLQSGLEAINAEGETVVLNVIDFDSDDYPENEDVLNRTLYSDAEGGIVEESSWYAMRLPFGRSVLSASLTLMLVILPVLIIASQEALRAVPSSLRQGALGLGCTRWQVVRNVTLPAAIPGIMTGSILSMSRAIGEAAPILMIAGIVRITAGPKNLMDDFSILPLQIYYWTGQPAEEAAALNFQHIAAGGIIVLLLVLFTFNFAAIMIRQYAQKQLS